MQGITVCFFIGIYLLLQCNELPKLYLILLLPISLWLFQHRTLRYLAIIILGFCWAWLRAEFILTDKLDLELEGQIVEVYGEVVSLPISTQFGQRFLLKIDQDITFNNVVYPAPRLVRLSWNQHKVKLSPGQYWRCDVKLKRPMGFMNPGGFDFEYWLFYQGVRATGYVAKPNQCLQLRPSNGLSVDNLRDHLREKLKSSTEQTASYALLLALLVGDKSYISTAQWKVLQKTGTSHLLAISGLHIGLVFGLGFVLSKWLAKLYLLINPRIPAPRLAMSGGIIVAIFYAALAGFSLPTQRALVMLLVAVVAAFFYRRLSASTILSLSLFFILLIDPFAINTAGFWLSFMAVATILFGIAYRVETKNLWWQWGRAQYLVSIALFPLVLYWFNQQAPLGFLANIIAIPIVSFFIVPFTLVYGVLIDLLPNVAELCLYISDYFLQMLWQFLSYLAEQSIPVMRLPQPGHLTLIISLLGLYWFLLPKGFPAKQISWVLLLPLFFSSVKTPAKGELWFSVLDVGQGLATVVQTRNHVLIYDTGARFSEKFDIGSAVIAPFLRHQAIDSIDTIVVSHGDNDHIGGIGALMNEFQVDHILHNPKLTDRKLPFITLPCLAGKRWQWDGIEFEILHPESPESVNNLDRNQSSCVLKISLGEQQLLLTGDIDRHIENQLLNQYGDSLKSTILLVPHHGSKSSSSEAFLDTVSPDLAIIASGYRNRFGFPKQVIIDRYQRRNISLMNTAVSGTIALKLTDSARFESQYRVSHRRFWHTIP